MKKLILILPLILFSCTQEKSYHSKNLTPVSLDTLEMSIVEKTEMMLQKTEGLEDEIRSTYSTKESLLRENRQLRIEIKTMKDSLVEVISKLPKKQNFIQKVFNIEPDSIEIITIDTIK